MGGGGGGGGRKTKQSCMNTVSIHVMVVRVKYAARLWSTILEHGFVSSIFWISVFFVISWHESRDFLIVVPTPSQPCYTDSN